MGGDIIVPASLGGLALLKYLIIFTLAIHLPFICTLMGSLLLSLGFNALGKDQKNEKYLRFAKDLVDKFSVSLGTGLLLGFLPLVTLIVMFSQLMYGTRSNILTQWLLVLGLSFVGLLFTYGYKNSFCKRDENFLMHFGLGKAAFGSLSAAYFIFFCNKAFMMYPHNWAIVEWPIFQSFSSVNITQFVNFTLLALAFTGAGIVFYFRTWADDKNTQDAEYNNFACKVGIYTVLVGTLLQPVIGIVDLYFLPEAAVSQVVVNFYIGSVIWGMFICLTVFSALSYKGQPEKGASVPVVVAILALMAFFFVQHHFAQIVVMFIAMIVIGYLVIGRERKKEKWLMALVFGSLMFVLGNDYNTRSNSMTEQMAFLHEEAEKKEPAPKGDEALVGIGEKIYQEKCASCHTIDGSPLAAPSFLAVYGRKEIVVTGGEEREITVDDEYIAKSINNPGDDVVKGFANVMPAQNLDESQIRCIIAFLKSLK